MDLFENKNCLVTGATGGLGIEIAKEMANKRVNLFLTGRNNEKLKALKEELAGYNVFCQEADFNSLKDINDLIDGFKEIDILINCAGIFPVKSLIDSTIEDYEKCFNVNVRAPIFLSKAFSKRMIEKKWGRIVNIASSSAYGGFSNTSLYCASKHALLGFSRSIFKELKDYNVRVYCVSPGSIKTEMGEDVLNQDFETFIDPKEIAQYVSFLMSFDANLISEEIKLNRLFI